MLSTSVRRQQPLDLRALRGVPAYLYILRNTSLKEGLIHIGLSRRGGWAKALELNRDRNNLIPGIYECVFELRAQDSGSALESVFAILKHARHGRVGQDYFEIDEQSAQHIIQRCVETADKKFQLAFQQDLRYLEFRDHCPSPAVSNQQQTEHQTQEVVREGIFKRALAWLS